MGVDIDRLSKWRTRITVIKSELIDDYTVKYHRKPAMFEASFEVEVDSEFMGERSIEVETFDTAKEVAAFLNRKAFVGPVTVTADPKTGLDIDFSAYAEGATDVRSE
jgi:hypothetical protein